MYLREISIQFFKLLKIRLFAFVLLSFKFLFNWKVAFFFYLFIKFSLPVFVPCASGGI